MNLRISEKLNHIRAIEVLNDIDDELKLKLREVAEGKRGKDWRISERVMTEQLWTDQLDAVGDLRRIVVCHREQRDDPDSLVPTEPTLPERFRFAKADAALSRALEHLSDQINSSDLQSDCDDFDILNELKEYLDSVSEFRI